MKRSHLIAAVLLSLLAVILFSACASAADTRPLPVDWSGTDLNNGTFRLTIRDTGRIEDGGYFTAALFLEDRYDAAQILALAPDDTVLAGGRTWTVREIVPHTDDGSGKVYAYEVYPVEETGSYLSFEPLEDGTFIARIDDWVPVTPVGEIRVTLPLPDAFRYVSVTAGEEDEPTGADMFLKDADDTWTAYNTVCVMEDGVPVRITHASYPWGPEETTAASAEAVPVWRFCHGVREGLETAVIKGYETDCETGLIEAEISAEEAEELRDLALYGFITDKASDLSVTGGTHVYTFKDQDGKILLSIEMYRGLIVAVDGMYHYSL